MISEHPNPNNLSGLKSISKKVKMMEIHSEVNVILDHSSPFSSSSSPPPSPMLSPTPSPHTGILKCAFTELTCQGTAWTLFALDFSAESEQEFLDLISRVNFNFSELDCTVVIILSEGKPGNSAQKKLGLKKVLEREFTVGQKMAGNMKFVFYNYKGTKVRRKKNVKARGRCCCG
jgi:hypothetical protein